MQADIKISVIMGTYNGEKRIIKAIESIIGQTYKNWELIICDDCSTDNTFQLLNARYAGNPQIILLKLSQNSGLAAALNKCLEHTSGSIIARMDDDDWSHPDRFERQLQFLSNHPEVSVVGASINYFDQHGVYGKHVFEENVRGCSDIYRGASFVHPSVIIRKEALQSVNCYTDTPETLRCEDYELWCKLYYAGYKGVNMSDILLDYYEARDSIVRRKRNVIYLLYKRKLFWRKQFNLPFFYDYYAHRELLISYIPIRLYYFFRRIKARFNY